MIGDNTREALADARESGVFHLGEERLREFPPELRSLTGLREIYLTDADIKRLPPWIEELTSLEVLDLADNPIEHLPASLANLPVLRQLGLSNTGVTDLKSLSHLTNLEALVVPGNGLTDVPAALGALTRLRVLDLGGNPIASVADELGRLHELTHLYLWGHTLAAFPAALRDLRRLEVLELSNAGLHDVDRDAGDRFEYDNPPISLSRLVGSGGGEHGDLRELPETIADELPCLRKLFLSSQRLQRAPRLPGGLEVLYVAANELTEIPDAVFDLPRLARLDLRRNRITSLPPRLATLGGLKYLGLAENDLAIPPEVLADASSPARVLDYAARVRGPTRPLDQAKLLVVGEGSVGKTSLIKRLVSDSFNEDEQKTEGIEVSSWSVDVDGDPILLKVWDFGGQEIMHATHQFFLTKRSLYLLVIDARQGEEQNRIEYWLKLIESFSGGSPVVIVGNKTEQSPLDIDTRGLRAKYANIVAIFPVSCKTGDGIAEVERNLAKALERMPHVRDPLPEAFFEIKAELEGLSDNFVPYGDYIQRCKSHGVTAQTAQETLVGFLHDLGTVLCFRDDPRLSDTNILNPQWVTRGVYRLLNSHMAAQRKGILKWDDVNTVLDTDDYPPERRSFIVDMMKKFELCYESEDVFLIPDLLTKEEPDTGTWEDALHFEIDYHVLPTSVLSRLIVRMHTSISKSTVWRTGVVLAIDRNRALVKADREDAIIRIAVSGPASGRRGLLTAVRRELRGIETTIPGLAGEERVPVPGHHGVWVPYQHLLEMEGAGHETVVPLGLTEGFSIRDLLSGVEAPADRSAVGSSAGGARQRELHSPPAPAEGRPWTPAETMRLLVVLLLALVVLVGVYVGADQIVGTGAAAAITGAALAGVVGLGVIALRSSGRMSEQGTLEALKDVLGRA